MPVGGSKPKQVHNAAFARDAKVDLRRRVLNEIGPAHAHVFDMFCGPVGEMWSAVWHEAASYAGADEEFRLDDARTRYVGDSYLVARSIDLQPFNVFDVDPFGSPWQGLLIIAARRKWKKGERGAVVITDGGALYTKFNGPDKTFAQALGMKFADRAMMGGKLSLHVDMRGQAIRRWLASCAVRPLRMWEAHGNTGTAMGYTAIVFEGA